MASTDTVCRCGHTREAHRHYRAGSDCGHDDCGCRRFQKGATS